MSHVTLSIIVPVYNVEDYLGECIDSILQQTFRDFELILVDDGSTDSSGQICDEYAAKDDRIVVVHKENEGVSKARNVALTMAKGDYLTFVDSDDFIESNTYKDNMEIMLGNTDIDILQFPCVLFPYVPPPCKPKSKMIEGRESLLTNWWAGDVLTFAVWNKIFKRQIFDNLTFLEHHVSEDTRLVVDFYKRAKCVYLSDKGCYYYRQYDKSQTAHYSFGMHIDLFEAHLMIYREMTKFPSLVPQLPVAYERLLRRLLLAYLQKPDADMANEFEAATHIMPSWLSIIRTKSIDKRWLAMAKMLGVKRFFQILSLRRAR